MVGLGRQRSFVEVLERGPFDAGIATEEPWDVVQVFKVSQPSRDFLRDLSDRAIGDGDLPVAAQLFRLALLGFIRPAPEQPVEAKLCGRARGQAKERDGRRLAARIQRSTQ